MRFFVLAVFASISSVSAFASEFINYSAVLDDADQKFHDIEVCKKIASSELLLGEFTDMYEDEPNPKIKGKRSIKDYYVQNDAIHSIFRVDYLQIRDGTSKKMVFKLTCSEFVIDRFAH